jgi:hypothetical protein
MALLEEADFENALQLLSIDMIRFGFLDTPVAFDWYYNDHLYTDVKFVAIIENKITHLKWMFPYAFWSLSVGIQSRHFFKLRYSEGCYVIFENLVPFEGDLSEQVEARLRDDVGAKTPMEMVRDICRCTGVLITPQFISLSRKAKAIHASGNTPVFLSI